MKSITIHGLDKDLDNELQNRAQISRQSLNQTIKHILRHSLGLSKSKLVGQKNDFSEFAGIWSEKEAREFDSYVKTFEQIDTDV